MGVENSLGNLSVAIPKRSQRFDSPPVNKYNPNTEEIRGVFSVTDDGLIRVTIPEGDSFRFSRRILVGRLDDARARLINGSNVNFVVEWENEERTRSSKVLYFDQTLPHIIHTDTIQ